MQVRVFIPFLFDKISIIRLSNIAAGSELLILPLF